MIFDDVGDNISNLNPFVNEMTGIYWIWKHLEEVGNPDYVGLCHYRRFFRSEDIRDYTAYDIINISAERIFPRSIYRQYCSVKNHDVALLNQLMEKASSLTHCDTAEYFCNRFNLFKMCNMFIMKRELFLWYCGFMYEMIQCGVEKVNPIETLKDKPAQDKRTIGFALERMSSFCMDYMALLGRKKVKTLLNIDFFKEKPL